MKRFICWTRLLLLGLVGLGATFSWPQAAIKDAPPAQPTKKARIDQSVSKLQEYRKATEDHIALITHMKDILVDEFAKFEQIKLNYYNLLK